MVWVKMGPDGGPETSVTNYQHTLRKTPLGRRSRLQGGGSLKSRVTRTVPFGYVAGWFLETSNEGTTERPIVWVCIEPSVLLSPGPWPGRSTESGSYLLNGGGQFWSGLWMNHNILCCYGEEPHYWRRARGAEGNLNYSDSQEVFLFVRKGTPDAWWAECAEGVEHGVWSLAAEGAVRTCSVPAVDFVVLAIGRCPSHRVTVRDSCIISEFLR